MKKLLLLLDYAPRRIWTHQTNRLVADQYFTNITSRGFFRLSDTTF